MQEQITNIPSQYEVITAISRQLDFNMASDIYTGSLLKTLVASKPGGRILELGTGSGTVVDHLLHARRAWHEPQAEPVFQKSAAHAVASKDDQKQIAGDDGGHDQRQADQRFHQEFSWEMALGQNPAHGDRHR